MPVVIARDAGHVVVVVIFFREEDGASDMGQEHGSFGAEEDGALVGDVEVTEDRSDFTRRAFVAVVPGYLDGGAFGERGIGEDILDPGIDGPAVGIGCGAG